VKFCAGLAVSLNLVATVDNVQHIDRLRIQVHFCQCIIVFCGVLFLSLTPTITWAHWAALISIHVALSQTLADTARPLIWG